MKKTGAPTLQANELEILRTLLDGQDGWDEWIGPGGRTLFVSAPCERFTGLSAATLQAAPERLLECIHPEDRRRFIDARSQLPANNARPKSEDAEIRPEIRPEIHFEFRLGANDVAPRWIAQRARAVTQEDGSLIGYHIHYADISAQKHAELALRRERQGTQALINTPTDVFLLVDRQGRILAANEAMLQEFGLPLSELQGRVLWSLFQKKQAEFRQTLIERVLNTGIPERVDDVGHSGRVFDSTVYPVQDEDGNVTQAAILARDVTEQHRMMQALRQAHDELETRVAERTAELLDTNRSLSAEIELRQQAEERWRKQAAHAEAVSRVASHITVHLELDTLLRAICEEVLAELPGYSIAWVALYDEQSDAITPRACAAPDLEAGLSIPAIPRTVFEVVRNRYGTPIVLKDSQVIEHPFELKFIRQLDIFTVIIQPLETNGDLVGYLAAATTGAPRLPNPDEAGFLHDLAEHARIAVGNARLFQQVTESRQRLRALSDRLIEVREDERRALAYELHDEFGQSLTVLSLSLEAAARGMQSPPDRPQPAEDPGGELATLDGLRAQVSSLLQKTRDLAQDLRPGVLDDLGLAPALLDYCRRFTRQTGVAVHIRQSGVLGRFTPQIETTVFRLAQEALTNVAHHAHVGEAYVLLWSSGDLLGLRVEDHGVGFDPTGTPGLTGMQERAALCGGSLEIESAPGRGTILTLEIPLTAASYTEGPPDDH